MPGQDRCAHIALFCIRDVTVHTLLFALGVLYISPHGYGMWKNNALCRLTVHWGIVAIAIYGHITQSVVIFTIGMLTYAALYAGTLFICIYFTYEKHAIHEEGRLFRHRDPNPREAPPHIGSALFF